MDYRMMRNLALAGSALALVACSGQAPDSPETGEATQAAAAALSPAQQAYADANARMHAGMADIPADADEAFMRGMLAHHRGAVEMAQVQLEYGKDPAARELAENVIAAQTEEIAQMEAWLAERGVPAEPPSQSEMTGHEGH